MGSAVGSYVAVGTAEEATFNTPAVVNRWFETTGEELKRVNRTFTSAGFGGGGSRNAVRTNKSVLLGHAGAGNFSMEVPTTLFGRWLKHILGGTPTVVQQGATAAWLQTHVVGDLTGKSQTIQKQLRDASNAEVETFTFSGTKVASARFAVGPNGALTVAVGLDSATVATSVAAAAAAYTDPKIFHWGQGELRVGETPVATVSSAAIDITNPIKTDRYYMGAAGTKKEQLANGRIAVGGTLTAEFDSPATFYDRFAAHSVAEIVWEFLGDVISGAHREMIRFTIPAARFPEDATPVVSGEDVVLQDVPFAAFWNNVDSTIKIEYMSTDTAV